jgi:hypothetical protein
LHFPGELLADQIGAMQLHIQLQEDGAVPPYDTQQLTDETRNHLPLSPGGLPHALPVHLRAPMP